MSILVTNDDGIQAEGIQVLARALASLDDVVVVAPDRPRSACGHAITLHKPLRLARYRMGDIPAYAASGTPADCVILAVRALLKEKPGLVVSGINAGSNLGTDVTYSGTVSGAMEGAILGVPAVAVSITSGGDNLAYPFAARFAAHLARAVLERGFPPHSLLNVNIPHRPQETIRGVAVTRLGERRYPSEISIREDPNGRTYYWLGGNVPEDVLDEGTDVKAIQDGLISVTPLKMDLTEYPLLSRLEGWNLSLDSL
ncbi:MAG: 5'/3'-nucleotidase SurE [Armatimonadetes bacterium]|nr:5'/3'-nucleotidase SurE [Armatimonadota bacterium]